MDNTHQLVLRIAEAMGLEIEPIFPEDLDKDLIADGWEPMPIDYKVTKKPGPKFSDIKDRFTDYSGGTLHYIHNDDLSLAICTEYKGKE